VINKSVASQIIYKFVKNQPLRYMKNIFSLAVFGILLNSYLCISVRAQSTPDPKDIFVEAESYFLFEEYEDALPLYQKLLRIEPENYNVIYKIGICYLNNPYQKEKSIGYLEQAVLHINPKYKHDNYKEKLAPLESHYYLGKAYHENNRFEEALESYDTFKSMADPRDYDIALVEQDIKSCEYAKELMANPVFFRPKPLGENINTRFEETRPVVSGDGNTLVFNRKLQFYTAVFIAAKNDDGDWGEPLNLTPEFGLDGNSYVTGISYFGDEIYVYRSDEYDGNIYFSKKTGNKWGALQKLNDHINTKYWESHASPSPDGKYLYFTSNREGGYGGLDIYRAKRSTNNQWGGVVNMGPVINSPGNEETPFVGNEGYTLFFSSQGHKTMGDYDIFITHLKSNGTWSRPRNMGSPINTTSEDIFYSPMNVNAFGFYAFYNESESQGLKDIYLVEVYNEAIPRTFTVNGTLQAAGLDEEQFKNIKVVLYDAKTGEVVSTSDVDENGNYSLQATQGEYVLVVEGENIEPYQQNLSLNVDNPNAMLTLPPIALTTAVGVVPPLVLAVDRPEKQKIIAKNDFYAVADSSPVAIELLLPKKAILNVQAFLADTLYLSETINTERKRFTYFYRPKPGENIIDFTATDENGDEYGTRVIVTYYPPVDASSIALEEETLPPPSLQGSYIGWVASDALLRYLEKLQLEDFENYYELYEHLLKNAAEEGYTKADVDEMYSILFTQKNLVSFDNELTDAGMDNSSARAELRDSVRLPIEYLQVLQVGAVVSQEELQNILLSLLHEDAADGDELLEHFLWYSDLDSIDVPTSAGELTYASAWDLFLKNNPEESGHELQIAATTSDLDFFYENLYLASEGALKDFLKDIKLDSLGMNTAINLTQYLFVQEPVEEYSIEDLIKALEKASANSSLYLSRFHEALTAQATGSLKSELMQMQSEEPDYNTYEGLINYLIDQSEFKDYTRENVYALLLDLIDIKDVNEFAEKLKSYQNENINKALADTSIQYFSNPFELIQYLLSVSDRFNYTESDINNLLIRMILEQGLSDSVSDARDKLSFKFWKDNKFVATVILVNLLIVILVVLFLYRRKSNR
jgi:Tol biopolymer transport system component